MSCLMSKPPTIAPVAYARPRGDNRAWQAKAPGECACPTLPACFYLRRREVSHNLILTHLIDHQFVRNVAALGRVELHRLVDVPVLLLGEIAGGPPLHS